MSTLRRKLDRGEMVLVDEADALLLGESGNVVWPDGCSTWIVVPPWDVRRGSSTGTLPVEWGLQFGHAWKFWAEVRHLRKAVAEPRLHAEPDIARPEVASLDLVTRPNLRDLEWCFGCWRWYEGYLSCGAHPSVELELCVRSGALAALFFRGLVAPPTPLLAREDASACESN